MARDDPHFRLRLPFDLKERIEADAKLNKRSINAEIISRIERTIAQDDFLESEHMTSEMRKVSDDKLDYFMTHADLKLLFNLLETKLEGFVGKLISTELDKMRRELSDKDSE